MTGGEETDRAITEAVCEVAALMADRLQLGEGVRRALSENLERWDGKGGPRRLRADDIALAARIAEPARQAVLFHASSGEEAALEMVRRRSGGWFDPAVAEAFSVVGPDELRRLEAEDPWAAVLAAEPSRSGGSRRIGSSRSPERSRTSSTSRRRSRWATRPGWPRSRRRRQRGSDFRTPSGSCSPVSCTTSAGPA